MDTMYHHYLVTEMGENTTEICLKIWCLTENDKSQSHLISGGLTQCLHLLYVQQALLPTSCGRDQVLGTTDLKWHLSQIIDWKLY